MSIEEGLIKKPRKINHAEALWIWPTPDCLHGNDCRDSRPLCVRHASRLNQRPIAEIEMMWTTTGYGDLPTLT